MSIEAWFRNPHNYIRELAEVGNQRVVWDRGIIKKKRIDPIAHAKLYFGENADFRILLIGPQGTAELDSKHGLKNPVGVYPTWEYGESLALLEEMIAHPIGMQEDLCKAVDGLPPDEIPVLGQEHRVVIINPPNATLMASRQFYREIQVLAEDYPDVILHVHGTYSYRVAFGTGFKSADFEPRELASKGRVTLPSGKNMQWESTLGCQQWVLLLGVNYTDLKQPQVRCKYNIMSALWASKNWDNNLKFKVKGPADVNPDAISNEVIETKSPFSLDVKPKAEDKIICNSCSLSNTCKFYREGSVCSLPESKTSELAKIFQSRDSDRIIDGLGSLLAKQAERAERAVEDEEEWGELRSDVTKLIHQIFSDGVTLAKLIDPNLRGGTKVQVNVGATAPAHAISASTPNQLVGIIVQGLEEEGINRADITPAMIEAKINSMSENTVEAELVP